MSKTSAADRGISLIVRRTIRAPAERLFAAWTQPAQLTQWWGPKTAVCPRAEVDLRIGGRYRIANRFPDGRVVWIAGAFERVEPPHRLVYTWTIEPAASEPERVSVRFEPRGDTTEVIVEHARIASRELRDGHERGWSDCLDGLERHTSGAPGHSGSPALRMPST